MIWIKLGIAAVLSASLLAGGCTPVYMPEDGGKVEASGDNIGNNIKNDGKKSGTIEGEMLVRISEPQQELILEYMERYYKALSQLDMAEINNLFFNNASASLALNENAWEYVIGLRSMQQTDLHLENYRYELIVDEVEYSRAGLVTVSLTEHSIQNFAQHPDIDSELYNISHVFVLREETDGWKIESHMQYDGIYQNMLGVYSDKEIVKIHNADAYFDKQKTDLLALANEGRIARNSDKLTGYVPTVVHAYNRAAALEYANQWVGKRNNRWSDFTGRGGNCQNFVSQCLAAGGIPMDTEGEAVWQWYHGELGEESDTYGNSASWISVDAFYWYARANRGFGLAAVTDASYFDGEAGDIIRMGFPGVWSHTVLITDVIRDEKGETIDYLVHSNTADLKSFPVSAYSLPYQSLVKINGWN